MGAKKPAACLLGLQTKRTRELLTTDDAFVSGKNVLDGGNVGLRLRPMLLINPWRVSLVWSTRGFLTRASFLTCDRQVISRIVANPMLLKGGSSP